MERKEFYTGLYKELHADYRETSRYAEIIRKVQMDGLISKLAMWEYQYLDEDEGTKGLVKRLEDGENIFTLLFAKDWANFAHSKYHASEALEKYAKLIPPGYFEKLVGVNPKWHQPMHDRKDFNAMVERFKDAVWMPDALKEWGNKNLPPMEPTPSLPPSEVQKSISHTSEKTTDIAPNSAAQEPQSFSPQQELAAENAALRKRVADLEDANSPPAERVKLWDSLKSAIWRR